MFKTEEDIEKIIIDFDKQYSAIGKYRDAVKVTKTHINTDLIERLRNPGLHNMLTEGNLKKFNFE